MRLYAVTCTDTERLGNTCLWAGLNDRLRLISTSLYNAPKSPGESEGWPIAHT